MAAWWNKGNILSSVFNNSYFLASLSLDLLRYYSGLQYQATFLLLGHYKQKEAAL